MVMELRLTGRSTLDRYACKHLPEKRQTATLESRLHSQRQSR